MQSLLHEIFTPAITEFLEAAYKLMNRRPILLKVKTEYEIRHYNFYPYTWMENHSGVFYDFIRSPLFQQMMLEFDKRQEMPNYFDWDGKVRSEESMVKKEFTANHYPISVLGFAERLHWILLRSFRPYAEPMDEKRALELIANFWQEIFGNDVPNPMNPPVKWAGIPYWLEQPWRFLDIRPDFLYSDQYEDNLKPEEIHPLFYFSGLPTDSCTFFYKDNIFYLLLTTGSP